jgi:hypothetical protein
VHLSHSALKKSNPPKAHMATLNITVLSFVTTGLNFILAMKLPALINMSLNGFSYERKNLRVLESIHITETYKNFSFLK